MESTVVEESNTLTLPDEHDLTAMRQFIDRDLQPLVHIGRRGAKTLARSLDQYMRLRDYADKHLLRAARNLNTVNGVRTPTQKGGDKRRSLQHTAEKFYSDMNTASLRQYCTLFALDFDSYDTIEDVISALVDRHVQLQQQS